MVDGEYFTHLLYFRDWVRRFQVVQTSPSTVVFRVVTDSAVPRRDREEIAQKTRSALGPGCEVTFETVDEIAPLPSGKLSYTLRDF
jgi:phenylacetate-CoA ligase